MSALFQTVALVGKYNSPDIGDALLRLARFFLDRDRTVLIEERTAAAAPSLREWPAASLDAIGEKADLVVVFGGDGTMLNIARALVPYGSSLVGVNQGRLGFLTDVSVDTMFATLEEMLEGEYSAEERFLLETTVRRQGQEVFTSRAFNDVVMSKGVTGRIIEFEVFIDGQFVYSQRSDGLIIATPTGSTAYALSAGGPILYPTLEAFVLVPICPHTLSNRPIAVNSESTVEVLLLHADDALVHFDGQSSFQLKPNDWVIVRRSKSPIRLLHPLGHSYYDTLRQKLRWGEKL